MRFYPNRVSEINYKGHLLESFIENARIVYQWEHSRVLGNNMDEKQVQIIKASLNRILEANNVIVKDEPTIEGGYTYEDVLLKITA